ncbi:MAG TPA: response regulator transcription factor [Natronosporangium sp.]|nr:response regulator transcription factor [Natronosporangium sp.]
MTSGPRPVRVLVADSAPLLRSGFRSVLAAYPDLSVVGEAGDGVATVDLARRLLPDVVLMDLRLPRLDGVAATRAIVTSRLPVQVLLLTRERPDAAAVPGLQAGARGVLPKDIPADDLATAIRAVAAGQAVLDPPLLQHLLTEPVPAPEDPAPRRQLAALTEREREVLVHVARGYSNSEIARLLSVGETTVKTHVGNLLAKLGLRDRVQAVVVAYESGLVRPQQSTEEAVGRRRATDSRW